MRTAILFAAILISESINSEVTYPDNVAQFIAVVIVCAIVMDVVEFIVGLSKND